MSLHLFTALPSNLFNNFAYLKQDYIGLTLNFNFLINFILGFLISLSFIVVSLLLGQKIRTIFFRNSSFKDINYLIDAALGTIAIGTGVTLLGVFSLLNTPIILCYLILLFIISLYKFNFDYIKNAKKNLLNNLLHLKKNKFVLLWLSLFILLALVNLINPEIREDQYHVDFPKMYLAQQTIMVPPKEQFHVSASPLLSEMSYILGIFVWSEESARYIHFMFYLLVLLTLLEFSKVKNYEFSIYTPLLFATAPVVIHETSSMYVDFQWIFYFLLSILIITKSKKITYSIASLSGILIGAMVASKLWTIVIVPVFILYLLSILNKIPLKNKINNLFVFLFCVLSVSLIWFIRAYLLTGNPLFPAFANQIDLGGNSFYVPLWKLIGTNFALINPLNNLNVFSPLFFIGCIFFIYKFKDNIKELIHLNLFKLIIILFLLYSFINYPYGRYLLGIYVLLIFIASIALEKVINNFKISRYLLFSVLLVFFVYYFVNSILVLPYTFGVDNKNKYLTRILSRDNSSYYNFDNKFDKYISTKDYVATYGVFGYYYANFKYIDINYIYNKKGESFNILKEKGITKLFIKGGDINYFCQKLSLKNCTPDKYSYLSSYMGSQPYYLYNIK